MSSKVALGIFWDIENCAVPLTKSASSVAKQLRDFIAAAHPECGYAKEFFCVCDTRKVDERLLEGLDKNGVVVVHVNSTAKNAADDKLQELIDMYVDKYGVNGSAVLCIITGDINFAKPIRNARRKDLDVLLIHGKSCSLDLKNLVNECYLYEDILKGADNVVKADNQLKCAYLEVSNLPTDQTFSLILGRLVNLSANCGGKPETITNGMAFIRFGCKDDAQRCQQRIDGQDVSGFKIKVRLLSGNPQEVKPKTFDKQKSVEQTSAPIATKFKNKTLSQQNLAKNATKSQTDLTQTQKPDEGDECRSIIIGLIFKKGTDLKKLVQELIMTWNDKKLKPDLVKAVNGGKLNKSNTGDTLHVLAITPEASKILVRRSRKYLKDKGIKWFPKFQKKTPPPNAQNGENPTLNDVKKSIKTNKENLGKDFKSVQKVDTIGVTDHLMSVIKGLETKKDDNVAKIVRKIVETWADKSVHPNYIKTVERDRKFADKDGVVLLFVTSQTSENSEALVAAANRNLKPTDCFQWTTYQRKRQPSKDTDTESNVSESFEFVPRPKASTLDSSKPPAVKKLIEIAVTDDMQSVITGLETKKDENVAKVVRRVIFEWKNPKLNGNMIRSVERFPDFPDEDGKIPLLVTAISAQACVALVAGAQQYLDLSRGILWTHFKSDPSSVFSKTSIGLEASTPLALNLQNISNGFIPKMEVKPQPFGVQQNIGSETVVRPKTIPVNAFVPPQVERQFDGQFVPAHITNMSPIVDTKRDNFVVNHMKLRSDFSTTSGAQPLSSLSSLTAEPKHVMTSPIRLVAANPRKDDSDTNLLKSLVSGFESLFKSSKSSPKKTVSAVFKPLDSDLFTDSALKSLNPIYFPPVPFNQFFPEGLAEGFTLCISGRLNTSFDCFAIDFFVNNTDIAFHFNVRGPHSLVIRNSLINGGWGPEEREIPNFPFFDSQSFEIIIRAKKDRYLVAVNRQHYCDYEHRIAINSVSKLSINGGISIDCLRIS